MGTTRLTLSIEDIEDRISTLETHALMKEHEAEALQAEAIQLRAKAKRLEELKALALEVGTPVPSGRSRINRQLQIANFILENGPQTRKSIIEKTGIPEGTVNSEMRDKEVFTEVGGNLWDVTEEFKRQRAKQPPTEEDSSQAPDYDEEEGSMDFLDELLAEAQPARPVSPKVTTK